MKVILTQLFVVFLTMTVIVSADKPGCKYPDHISVESKKGEDQIAVLSGDRFTVDDADDFVYSIGICTDAIDPYPPDSKIPVGAGVVQYDKISKNYTLIGRYDSADIMAGPEWVLLEYNNGEKYGHHCQLSNGNGEHENRRARILFICDQNAVEPVANIIEEQNQKYGGCYYLFEISTTTVCPKQPLVTIGLSVGSVLLIVFFSLVAVYLIGGCAYNRFVLGSKGLDQIPNRAFWQDFGNLQADGCDLICRTKRSKQQRMYKGIGDDQLQDIDDHVITDENLLPM